MIQHEELFTPSYIVRYIRQTHTKQADVLKKLLQFYKK